MKYLILVLLILNFISIVGADCSGNQIDINSASEEELDEIIWVGSATAQKIIEGRPYETLKDIKKVYGIGDSKLEDIKEQGLACVEGENIKSKISVEKIETVKESLSIDESPVEESLKQKIVPTPQEKEIILNSIIENSGEVVYESKNFKILKYIPYAFSVFLIFVVIVLIFDK